MANQKKSQQAKKVEAMGKKAGATKAQVAQGLARAGGKSTYNVTKQDVKKAGQAAKIIAGAAITAVGPGKVVKGAKAVQAAAKMAKSNKAAKAMLNRKSEYANIDRSVKTIYNGNTPERVAREYKVDYNRLSDKAVTDAKSGKAAKQGAAQVEKGNAESGRTSSFRKKVSDNVTVKIKQKSPEKVKQDMAELTKINGRKTIPATTKAKIKAEARALKAANKPVSKNNAGQNASKLKIDILKNAKPARANRTRLGKSVPK